MAVSLEDLRISNIHNIFNINYKDKRCAPRNNRTVCAIVYKLSGKTEYICDGKSYICDNKHVLLVPNYKPYIFDILEPGPCISIEFKCETTIDTFYQYKITDDTKIRSLFVRISQIWAAKGSGYMLSAFSLLYEILHTTYILSNTEYSVQKKEKALLPAVSYIMEHYFEKDITNDVLAAAADMSTVYFRKLFTKRYGVPPMKYLSNIKIEAAKNMLLESNSSVSDIADAVGFSSVYSFSRAFKKATKMSPTEFLNANQNFSL